MNMIHNTKLPEEITLKYSNIIFFDVETTGLDSKNDRITELAAINFGKNSVEYEMDDYIQLPLDVEISPGAKDKTGLTREFLEINGLPEEIVARRFFEMLHLQKKILLVAHNAQFDLCFILRMFERYNFSLPKNIDVIDTYTVFKDRAPYPHKLSDAISYYHLEGVENTHKAIDDVKALSEVFFAMCQEKSDILEYTNLFGVHHKYGLFGEEIEDIIYCIQEYNPIYKLPDIVKKNF